MVANTTLGRFLRLMMVNCGGTEPAANEAVSTGNPHKTSLVIYEAQDSPWTQFSSEAAIGFEDGTDTVSLFVNWGDMLMTSNSSVTYTGPQSEGNEAVIQDALGAVVEGLKRLGRPQQGVLLMISQKTATTLSNAGFTREDVVSWIGSHCVDTYAVASEEGLGSGVAGTGFSIQGVPIWKTGNWPEEWSDPDFDPQTVVRWFPNENSISLVVATSFSVYMNGNPRWTVAVDPWR